MPTVVVCRLNSTDREVTRTAVMDMELYRAWGFGGKHIDFHPECLNNPERGDRLCGGSSVDAEISRDVAQCARFFAIGAATFEQAQLLPPRRQIALSRSHRIVVVAHGKVDS